MKSIQSMPAMSGLDNRALAAKQKVHASLNRSQSLSNATIATDAITHLIRSTPFLALPGIDANLRGFSRSYSQFGLSGISGVGGYGTFNRNRSGSASTAGSSQRHSFTLHRDKSALPIASMDEEDIDGGVISADLLEGRYTWSLGFAVTVAVLSSFQVGYNSGVLNVPEAVIRDGLNLSALDWSFVVSLMAIGGLLGCYVGGLMAERAGRKNYLVTNNVCFIIGGLLQALASNLYMIAAGRFIVGIGCGGATVVVPLYLGEISPAHLRGSLGTMNQFAIVIGIFIANLIGNPLGGPHEWRFLVGLILLPSLLQVVLSSVLLESPLWLVLQGGRKSMMLAEEILAALRGTDDVKFDLDMMIAVRDHLQSDHTDNGAQQSQWQQLTAKRNRKSLIIGFALQAAQQFSGVNAVFYYSTAFFASANVQSPWLGSVLASGINVLATWLALNLMDRYGRRPLLLASAVGMMLSALALTFALNYPATSLTSYAAVATVLLYVTFFEIGLGPIPWLIGAEIYDNNIRSSAMSISSWLNWMCNFGVGLSFPHIVFLLGPYSFVPFAAVLALVIIFTWLYVPETAGKSLEEIQLEVGGEYADDVYATENGEWSEDVSLNEANRYQFDSVDDSDAADVSAFVDSDDEQPQLNYNQQAPPAQLQRSQQGQHGRNRSLS